MGKTLYKTWQAADHLAMLQGWAHDGLTDEQIAHNIGIRRTTLYDWKKRYPDIADALKHGKEVSDYEVENALFKRATGMVTVDEVTELISRNEAAIKLDRVAYAKKYREQHPDTPYAYAAQLAKANVPTQELVVTRKTKHELPPDTTAQIFWLKNRRPDLWRDRREVANQVSGHLDGPDMSHLTTAQLMAIANAEVDDDDDG